MPKGTRSRDSKRTNWTARDTFLWEAPWTATVIHSHIPPQADHPDARLIRPLPESLPAGRRDALSLLGQYAAHLAFLRFAGIGNTSFDASQWGTIKERGRDPRLVRRVCGAVSDADEMLPVTLLEQFNEVVGAPRLEVLRASWIRPEAVYAEVLGRIGSTAGGDWSSLRGAAWGAIRSPGPAILQEVLSRPGVTVLCDGDGAESARALGSHVTVLGEGANPLERWSGVRALVPDENAPPSETALAEWVLSTVQGAPRVLVVDNWRAFDAASRKVVRLLVDAGDPLSWILPTELASMVPSHRRPLPGEPTKRYLLSTRVAAEHEILTAVGARSANEFENWCREFCASQAFDAFVKDGKVESVGGPGGAESVDEPVRSFIRALAMLGRSFGESAAEAMLAALGFPERIEDVLATGVVVRLNAGALEFATESTREQLVGELGPALRKSLAALVADLPEIAAEPVRRVAMLVEAGRMDEADESAQTMLLDEIDAAKVVQILPRTTAAMVKGCPHVAAARCKSLVDLGRYADAAKESEEIEGSCGRFIRALVSRRLGDYSAALEVLGKVEGAACSFEEHLLAGELHRLKGHHDAAAEAFRRARAASRTARDRGRLAYEEALLAFDRGMQGPEDELPDNPYYESRYLFYESAGDGDLAGAVSHARHAIARAATVPERVDAELDLVFALFLNGDWDAARQEARAALVTLEETQGDRAAAGILFTLAFLCADDGQWSQAEQKIARLQHFYDEHEDERRARELDLLRAHLALCRLDLSEAQRLATALLGESLSAEMREAAALILDEIGWMRGELIAPHSSGESQCVELTNRHLVFVARTSRVEQHEIQNRFWASLCRWESVAWKKDSECEPPETANRSETLALLRSLIALHQRKPTSRLAGRIVALAESLGLRSPIVSSRSAAEADELRVLQLAVTEPFPWEARALGVDWRIVSKTRTGRLSQNGSLPPLDPDKAVQALEEAPAGWTRCGARSAVWIAGLEHWSDEARSTLSSIVELRAEVTNLRRLVTTEPPAAVTSAAGIIGESAAIRETIARIEPASRRDVAVCIEGESGTGKELIARAIHDRSNRRGRPFTAINCAALPENLIESELFGCVRGAFTGADRDRAGLIESTDEGTLFLDEIAEMALPAQAKLLRFLQEGEFRRVGGTTSRRADVRIIAATNRRLEEAVDKGEFRDDLYYRVRGIEIHVPPLRDRGADVLILARHFLRVEHERHGMGATTFTDEVEEMLLSHDWPGNVRELQQTIRAAHALAGEGRLVTAEHLPERMRRAGRTRVPAGSLQEEVTRFRRGLIENALESTGGNQSGAAKMLGVTRQALAYQIRELGILVEKKILKS